MAQAKKKTSKKKAQTRLRSALGTPAQHRIRQRVQHEDKEYYEGRRDKPSGHFRPTLRGDKLQFETRGAVTSGDHYVQQSTGKLKKTPAKIKRDKAKEKARKEQAAKERKRIAKQEKAAKKHKLYTPTQSKKPKRKPKRPS